MKQLSLVFALVMLLGTIAFGQRTITGSVTDENGPLPYANVIVKGTTVGTTTNLDGKYELKVPEGATTIEISYTGYSAQEFRLGDSNVIDAVLSEGVILEEAVVTALGIKREKKSLGYAAQEVDGEELTKVKDANFVNSLSGKVAGVSIGRSNTLGGSTNVIIRGSTSLNGNNQALFVVDGIPISNSNTNTTSQQTGGGGFDYGNAAMDINPEDVESISVLRGAAATALYGSRAANGVILITTKKGTKNKTLGVSISSGVTTGFVDKTTMPRYQKEYGAGYGAYYGPDGDAYLDEIDFDGDGIFETLGAPVYEDASYGGAYDPSLMVADWRSFYPELSTYQQSFPWKAAENGPTTFYENSLTFNNSIAIDGGSDNASFRLSYTNFDQKGIVPNSKLQKNTFSFGGTYDINDKWTAGVSGTYVNQTGRGFYGTGYDSRNTNQSFRQWYQTHVDIQQQKDAYEQTGLNISWNPYGVSNPAISTQPHYFDNYYFNVYENYNNMKRNRVIGNTNLTYSPLSWLDITGKIALDRYDEAQEERIAVGSVNVPEYQRYNRDFSEVNYEGIIRANKYFGADDIFSVSGLLGFNVRRTTINSIRARTLGGLVVPNVYSLANSQSTPEAPTEGYAKIGVNGYFANVSLGYNNMLYLDASARVDHASTLPKGKNVYPYPAVSMSFVFSELIDTKILSFGKLRLNWAQVGNSVGFFALDDVYIQNTPFGGTPLSSAPGLRNNPNLEPERTNSIEAGLELNFLSNRVGLDFSVYKGNTFNQSIDTDVSPASGSTSKYVTAGEIQNVGYEVALRLTPVKMNDFRWDMNINWSKNNNKVVSLKDDQTNFPLANYQGGVSLNAEVGQPYGSIWGSNYVFHTNGEKIVYPYIIGGEPNGVRYARTSTPEAIGNVNPDWTGGVQNTLTYKDLSLSFLIDVQKGGDFFSLDTWYGFGTGLYENTAGLNDQGNPVRSPVSEGGGYPMGGVLQTGVDADGNPISDGTVNTEYGFAENYLNVAGWTRAPNAFHIYDASYVKLREMSLTYSLPAKLFEGIPIVGVDLSLVGRNLWIIHKNSEYSDPETALSSGNIGRAYQSGAYPTSKEIGFNLNVKF